MDIAAPENRVPVALISPKGAEQLRWINTCNKRFTEPFFDFDTIRSLRLADPATTGTNRTPAAWPKCSGKRKTSTP